MPNQFEKLFDVARKTKTALLLEWKSSKAFADKNTLTKKGMLPEGIGLTSLLLLLVAFRDEKQVISEEDRAEIGELAAVSLKQLATWSENGFTATPLISAKNTGIFGKDAGYTDTVTWCLSSSILARYAERNGALRFDDETHALILDLMARALIALLGGQRADGTWGFRTDPGAQRSLYFTYSASASLADFYDYVLGEIEEVEAVTDIENRRDTVDTEVLAYLDSRLGEDTRQKVDAARCSLQTWLIRSCLPLLPKLAKCGSMLPAEMEQLGIWAHSAIRLSDGERYYYNLYYSYYLLDMMVTAMADKRYNDLLAAPDSLAELEKHYRDSSLMSAEDLRYFFNDGNADKLFTDFVEEAVHSTRMHYVSASRTGARFWATTDSELPISWIHEDQNITDDARIAMSQAKSSVTDPSIAPMALRANTVYSYYISEKPDITVERLFDDICAEVCAEIDEENEDNCVKDLWDYLYYSLPITERSVEAIVDFYDYLCKFRGEDDSAEGGERIAGKSEAVGETLAKKSALDAAVEERIAEYLASEAGRSAIREAVGDLPAYPAAQTPAAVTDAEGIMDELARLSEMISNTNILSYDGDEDDRMVAALVSLYEELRLCCLKKHLKSCISKPAGMTSSEYEKRIYDSAATFSRRTDDLLKKIVPDLNMENLSFGQIYDRVKSTK